MVMQAGYWVDLRGIKFDEGSTATWIQAMPLGSYEHPVHGTIEITPERVQQFAQNVKTNVRGQQLDIDYDHKDKSGEAAGWVQDAEARSDGLWLLVDWTKQAAQKIKDKAYRYFSPEFVDEWTHPKNGQTYKDVLFGGGITNRPFLKDILPINMSEVFAEASDQNTEGETGMDEKLRQALAKRFGLPEDAPEADVLAKVNEEPATSPEQKKEEHKEEEPQPVAASENAALKKLAEDNPAIKQLMETVQAQDVALRGLTKSLREKEVDASVTKLSEKAKEKGFALPPTTKEELKKALTEAPVQLGETVYSAFEKMLDGVVELKERGSSGTGERQEKTAVQKFNELVEAEMKANDKLSYSDATVQAASKDPQLFAEYREESFSGRE